MRRHRFHACIRLGCVRQGMSGWPLCFVDFDELPQETREAWRATWQLHGSDRRLAQEQWQVRFLDQSSRRIPLMSILIPRWEPVRPAKRRKGAA